MTLQQAFQLAVQHHQAGRLTEAEAFYRQVLVSEPLHAEALHYLGVIAHQMRRNDVALELVRRAIGLKPGVSHFHSNLGEVYRALGRLEEAIAAYRQAITLQPELPEFHSNFGNALRENGRLDEAIASYVKAIALRPDYAVAYFNLGNTLMDKGQPDEAVAAYRKAVAIRGDYPEAHSNLGNALRDKSRLDEAIAEYRQAITLRPTYSEAHYNLGVGLRDKGRLDEAVTAYREAIALNPNFPECHYNLSLILLLQGDFIQGWEEHEWRWKTKDFPSPLRNFVQAQWDGSPLDGRVILLHAEQGFGDALQLFRYVPLVRGRGGQVVVECHPELRRLLNSMAPDLQIVARGGALPDFDVHCPFLSLPRVFATDLSRIPKNVPYVTADATDGAMWSERLAGYSSVYKVGLVWAGSRTHTNDRNRSVRLADMAPLAEIPDVQFFSLQKGEAAAEALSPPQGMKCLDFTGELKDFADTAALIAALDLVISVDTAIVHLAGAMGKPVWTLLPFAPDWRWLLGRHDSPWYPSMRLFRQTTKGDWGPVIADVCEQLQLLVNSWRGES